MNINQIRNSQDIGNSEQVNRKTDKKAEQAKPAEQEGAKLSAHLQERLAATSDIRQERVAAVKQAREAGTYNVSDGQLANAMFKEFFGRG